MAWSSPGLSLKGQRGAQLIYGANPPTAADGFDGDSFIQTNGRLYAQKANGAWPTTYANLVGPAGGSVRVGNGSPTSTNPSQQNDLDVYVQLDAVGGPALWGPRANGAWPSTSTTLAGAAGLSVLSGPNNPTATDGVVGQPAFLNTSTGQLFGQKTSSGWPTTPLSLVGPKGSQFFTDTAPPGLQLGTIGDFFFQSNTFQLYQKITNAAAATTAQYPNGWLVLAVLKGDPGIAGSNGTNGVSPPGLYSGSGAPSSVTGAQVGSFYVRTDTTQLYGPLASGGWPTSGTSLIGPAGVQQPGVYNGSGPPSTTTAPGAVNGSYYIRTDVTPLTLYGPLASGTWPTTGVSMSGSQIYTQTGAPSATTGNVNDYSFDVTPGAVKLYPAKTSSGWTASPVSLSGPKGDTGTPGLSTLQQQSVGVGPQPAAPAMTLSATPTPLPVGGSTIPYTFAFPFSTSFMGIFVVSLSSACTLDLYDSTAGKVIWSQALGAGTANQYGLFTLTQYPMTANNQHQWRVSGSGTANVFMNPFFLFPGASQVNQSTIGGFLSAAGTTWSGSSQYLGPYGKTTDFNGSRQFRVLKASSLAYMQATYVPSAANAAAASVTLTLYGYNFTSGQTATYATSNALTNNSQSQIILQPGYGSIALPTGVTYVVGVTGSGTGQIYLDIGLIA